MTARALLILFLLGAAAVSAGRGRSGRGGRGGHGGRGGGCNWKEELFNRCYGEDVMNMFKESKKAAMTKCFGTESFPEADSEFLPEMIQQLIGGKQPSSSWSSWGSESHEMSGESENFNLDLSVSFPSKTLATLLSTIRNGKQGKRRGMGYQGKRGSWEDMGSSRGGYDTSEEYGSRGGRMPKVAMLLQGLLGGGKSSSEEKYNDFTSEERGGGGNNWARRGGMSDSDNLMGNLIDMMMMSMSDGKKHRGKRDAGSGEMEIPREDLIAKLEMMQKAVETVVANMTCFWQEMKYIDAEGNIDVEGLLAAIDSYGIENEFLLNNAKLVIQSCSDRTTAPSKEYQLLFQIDETLAKVMCFKSCKEKGILKICKDQDALKKLEESYGPVPDLIEETGLDKQQLLNLAGPLLKRRGRKGGKSYNG